MSDEPPFMPCIGMCTIIWLFPKGYGAAVCSNNQVEWYLSHGWLTLVQAKDLFEYERAARAEESQG